MRIGLIAMSGIRVCDVELLRLGLTLPGFVERSKTIASLPSLGLLTLAPLTPPGHQVFYREVRDTPSDSVSGGPADLEAFDLVAISTFTAQAYEAYALAERYRRRGTRVVMGGLHASAAPDEAGQHCDAVVSGEGEPSWPRVVTDAAAGRLQPRYHADVSDYALADAPVPAFELLDIERYNRLTVQTSRGCPFRCEFCASSTLFGPGYKQKPVAKVLAEIDRIKSLWKRPFIEFADDNSMVNRAYWRQLLPELARRRIKWFTETDISIGGDDELLDLMRRSGCAEVLIGLESPIEGELGGLELNSDWKRRQFPRYRQAIRNIQEHGIRVNGCFILGLDGQTSAVFDQIYRLVEETELYDVQITLLTPFPGTALYERFRREGRLLQERAWSRCTLFDLTFEPRPMSGRELVEGFRNLGVRLYSEDFTRWRRDRFASRGRRGGKGQSRRTPCRSSQRSES